ncbi:hypothetical protein D3C72_2052180 [compost metagenome]
MSQQPVRNTLREYAGTHTGRDHLEHCIDRFGFGDKLRVQPTTVDHLAKHVVRRKADKTG